MAMQGDQRLAAAEWADEATRAAKNPEARQAREHRLEDREAAVERARAASGADQGILARVLRRWGLRTR
jgi:hypothetical protein